MKHQHLLRCDVVDDDIIVIEHQDYVEDKIFELYDSLKGEGVLDIEIASALLFTLHYIACNAKEDEARRCYKYLLSQFRDNMSCIEEFTSFRSF